MAPTSAELLALASSLALRAADLVLAERERATAVRADVGTKSTPTDVVTAADQAAEQLIRAGIAAERPDDAVLGEEGGAATGSSGVRWLVDPIDGTVNYLYGIPSYAVSIAAEVDGKVQVGVVVNPPAGERWSAVLGGGSTYRSPEGRELPLSGSKVTSLGQALVGTGFGYDARRRAAQAQLATRVLPQVRDLRRIGSAALDLCAVAMGRLDAYYERGLYPWDLAAGGLVATEAGVRVEGLRGAPAGPDLVIAAPPAVFGPLHDLLAEGGADTGP